MLHCTVQRGAPRGADITHLSPFCHPPLFSFFGSLPFPLRPSSVPPLAAPLELESFPFFLFPKPPASPARPPLGLARALRKRSSSRARLAASKPSTSVVRVVWSDLTNSSCLPTCKMLPDKLGRQRWHLFAVRVPHGSAVRQQDLSGVHQGGRCQRSWVSPPNYLHLLLGTKQSTVLETP